MIQIMCAIVRRLHNMNGESKSIAPYNFVDNNNKKMKGFKTFLYTLEIKQNFFSSKGPYLFLLGCEMFFQLKKEQIFHKATYLFQWLVP